MAFSWWLGIGLGVSIVGLHGAARLVTHRLALRASGRHTFLLLELGGLGVRMGILFGAVVLILLYVPVHTVAFVTTVLGLLLVSMVVEVRLIIREMRRGALGP